MKPSERIMELSDEVLREKRDLSGGEAIAFATMRYLDDQDKASDLAERRAMPETSMGRDERATQKLRKLHDELRSWKLDYQQRISNLDPAANTRDFEITYKAFVVGIERLMEIIEQ